LGKRKKAVSKLLGERGQKTYWKVADEMEFIANRK